MTRAVHRAGFRPLAFASRHLLLRPAALKIAASIVLTLLALGLYSLSRGSYPLPASTLARALLAPQEMGEQPRFILFDIRLPRILMALLCGAMLGLAGAAMQSITRNGLADPGLIGVKEGASIVVLALVLFFPAVGLVWRPLAGMVGGIAVALLVLTLARDCSRPRFILIGIGVSWSLAAAVWGGDRFCMCGSLPRKTREALRDKALGRTSRICTASRKMRFCYDLCDEFCTITDC